MAIIDKLGAWLVGVILNWLLKRAQIEIEKAKTEQERKKINEENSKKYEDANSRAEKISAALDLINRERSP